MASPSPRPAHLKLANGRHAGVDSGGRKVELPPLFVRGAPDMPPVVACNDDAADEWNRICPELARLDLIKPIDSVGLAAYCLAWARLLDATRDIATHGIVIDVPGRVKDQFTRVKNPACSVADAATRELRQWCQEFGLTPSAEGRLTPPPGAGDDNADSAFDN